jgi:isoquinoline 1-oxidoreductase
MHPLADSELRQHESISRLRHGFELKRRDFFKLLGGGLVVGVASLHAPAQESGARIKSRPETPETLDSWLHIGDTGQITAFTGKVEVGQNVRTSLAQQVAEELRVPLSSVQMIMGDTELTPYDMGTFGSRTTPQMGMQLRKAAASARAVLIRLAGRKWQVPEAELAADNGRIRHAGSSRQITYAELMSGKQLTEAILDDPPLTVPEHWKVASRPAPKANGRDFVTGAHKYTSDIALPGMREGRVIRPDAFHAKLVSCDTNQAERLPDITAVRDGNFVGVVASDRAAAERAAAAVRAQWDAPAQPSETELFAYLRSHVVDSSDSRDDQYVTGSIEQVRGEAAKSLKETYTVAYIAHVPLEPRAAVADSKEGKLTVWTGTQRPFGVREELASTFHLRQDHVRVIVPDTGSAYGGKHTGEAAVEAARLAKAAGKPVKLVWTREEEFTWAYFRPSGVIDISSGAKADGSLLYWAHDNYNSGPSAMRTPYEVPNQRIAFHESETPLRQGSYRSLAAAANHFARESHMDELAHALKIDPLEFRLKNLKDERLRAALQAAAGKLGWKASSATPTRGFGIACGFEKGGYVATCAEISVEHNQVRIVRVVEAFDCGAVVNPQGLKNQIAGAVMQGLGGALFEAIHFENGRILNAHLADYRVPRFSDAPRIDVVLIDRKDQPSMGAGETPLVGVAPAVANAIFSATGIRIRSMPLVPGGLPTNKTDKASLSGAASNSLHGHLS